MSQSLSAFSHGGREYPHEEERDLDVEPESLVELFFGGGIARP
jgi:hypothetical protein